MLRKEYNQLYYLANRTELLDYQNQYYYINRENRLLYARNKYQLLKFWKSFIL